MPRLSGRHGHITALKYTADGNTLTLLVQPRSKPGLSRRPIRPVRQASLKLDVSSIYCPQGLKSGPHHKRTLGNSPSGCTSLTLAFGPACVLVRVQQRPGQGCTGYPGVVAGVGTGGGTGVGAGVGTGAGYSSLPGSRAGHSSLPGSWLALLDGTRPAPGGHLADTVDTWRTSDYAFPA